MKRIVCDKCGRDDLPPAREGDFAVLLTLPGKTIKGHLCSKCLGRLSVWMTEKDPQAMEAVA